MSDFLAAAREREQSKTSEPMRELQRVSVSGKVLAVCERADRSLVLARESERGLYPGGLTAPASEGDKRSASHGTERVLKPSASLADFADATEAGLI